MINLSGYSLPGWEEGDRELQLSKPPVFRGRGDCDDVIPQECITRTAIWLGEHSTLTERVYDMGHDVCPAELDDVAAFVNDRMSE